MLVLCRLEYFAFVVLLVAKESLQNRSQMRRGVQDKIQALVRQWAPLVFLAPGEKFFPSDVPEFLDHVIAIPERDVGSDFYEVPPPEAREDLPDDLPKGRTSESWYLTTRESVDNLLKNSSSFIYGRNPEKFSVPVYALIEVCRSRDTRTKRNSGVEDEDGDALHPRFHVTYWMFYPFSQGKSLCTFDMGRFGAWPIPKLNNYCLGNVKEFGNHVGDWEHMSLYFEGSSSPSKMYVSTHDVGAFYRYSVEKGRFEFERREIRKGILQRPAFPPTMRLSRPGNHPVLFSAKGSHGLWTAPGRHRFVRLPRLHDDSGFGIPWLTWKNVHMLKAYSRTERNWLRYRGKWGNQKSRCHPVSKLGINISFTTEGPKCGRKHRRSQKYERGRRDGDFEKTMSGAPDLKRGRQSGEEGTPEIESLRGMCAERIPLYGKR